MKKQKRTIAKFFTAFLTASFFFIAKIQLAFGQWDKSKLSTTQLPSTSLTEIISKFTLWILGIFGFIAVIGFIISGIIYLISAGDEDAQERAKRAMIYSITGVIVGLAGLVVVYAADSFLRGNASVSSSSVINSAANSPAAGASVSK